MAVLMNAGLAVLVFAVLYVVSRGWEFLSTWRMRRGRERMNRSAQF